MNESGHTLVETLLVLGIAAVLCSAAVPTFTAYSVQARVVAAGLEFQSEFRRARSMAIRSGGYTAIRFEDCAYGPCYSLYEDGNHDGVGADDINAGRDPRIAGPFPLTGRVTRVRVGINPGIAAIPPDTGLLDPASDPIRFGRSRMISFSPLGGATPGTFYLAGDGVQAAVRVVGGAARVRLLYWNGTWRER
jgi:type II secretory pathway pseudopilin PulG